MSATLSPRRVHRKPQPPARRRTGQKTKTAKCSATHASHDFLKQRFLPVSHFEGFQKNNCNQIEKQFFVSLSNLSQRFKLDIVSSTEEPFPFNILEAFQEVQKKLLLAQRELELIITEDKGKICIATIEELGVSYTLYYVPINALDWLHKQDNKPAFQLVASVFAYLHQTVRMPLQTDNDFMQNCYDGVIEWLENDEGEFGAEEWQEKIAIVKEMRRKLSIIERVVCDPVQLAQFSNHVAAFQPQSATEEKLLAIATKFLALQQEFPGQNFYQHIETEHREEEDQDRAYPDQYFSFFWDDSGWLEESLMHYINSYLQECCVFEQPVAVEYFTKKKTKPENMLAFEKRLLNLICELSSVTYQLIL